MPLTQIACLGLSHHSAPVELREQLTDSLPALQHAIQADTRLAAVVSELVLLSTCNRIELVLCVNGEAVAARPLLVDFLADIHGLSPAGLEAHAYYYTGRAACLHLLQVAAGLDSLVLGEPQILGQVTRAHAAAVAEGTSGPYLNALFQAAIYAGKRARTETAISHNPASVSSIAVTLAAQAAGDLRRRRVLLVGLGEMSRLALKALQARGVSNIAIANRTVSRAAATVAAWGGRAYDLSELPEALQAADVVITAVAAPEPLIHAHLLQEVMAGRNGRELVIVDLAVPRNVQPAAGRLPGLRLYDVDDLQARLDSALAARQAEVPKVQAILAAEWERLEGRLQALTFRPVIAGLRRKAEAIRQQEVERSLRSLGEADPAVVQQMQHLSRALVNKLLHEPTMRLKEEAGSTEGANYAQAVRDLFGLTDAGD